MLSTNLLVGSKRVVNKTQEGLANKNNNKQNSGQKNVAEPEDASAELDEEEAGDTKPQIDQAATVEQAYNNMSKMLGPEAMEKMSNDAHDLLNKQEKLMKSIEGMGPLMDNANKMLEKIDNMGINVGGMMEKMSGMKGMGLDSISSMFGGKKEASKSKK